MTALRHGRRQLLALAGSLLPLSARAAAPGNILRRAVEAGVIRVGVWLDAPPWGGFDADGRPDGSEVALARLLAQDMGLRLQLIRLQGHERVAALLEDRCDVLAAALPLIGSTWQRVAFTAPHGRVSVVLAAPSRLRLNSMDDLAGKRVAMPAGTFAADVAHARLPPGSIALFTPSLARTLESLLLGEADVAVTYDWQLRDLRLVRADLDIMPQLTLQSWNYGLATQLGQPDLMRFLNTLLFLRAADGSLAEIYARYFGALIPEGLRFR
ncbi:transporter substrate-binding domain-containing protein [Sediminicoccus sp. KRV36]|uniref:transporter substrate-binding domain-containing protein n=1 Tax=Sediminicoccus sp. KRV36 TaxID=3133721 RepID=UPI00200DDCFC|nr:transporter substrate-binding domain-containing protein [Sediminicoccus rosea]UPY37050.1 transporter substrate-binding domain-containing protein [Sediminicoccus rosea]